jgi:hypothetical protein
MSRSSPSFSRTRAAKSLGWLRTFSKTRRAEPTVIDFPSGRVTDLVEEIAAAEHVQ